MNTKLIHRIFGAMAFLLALVVYLLTVQPTVPFWDCGEFSAASIWQQVPHPPGAPLFLLIGKIFHIIIPFGDPAWRLNLVSVLSSAFTVYLLYLISVKVINNFRSNPVEDLADALKVYGTSFIGAAALVFSDTFWFNAVESEVYAMSSLFVALVVYLMMKWHEDADKPGSERYILLIAYLLGLSTGVHLLSILAIFSIVYVVYFRKYEVQTKSFIITGLIGMVIFFVVYPGIVKWIPALLAGHSPGKNEVREYAVSDSTGLTVLTIAIIILAAYLLYWGYKNKKTILNLVCGSFLLMILGYTTYTQILLRSNANPPMNENEPKNFEKLASYLGREQYGDSPLWPRRFQTGDYYTRHYNKKNERGEYIYGEWIPPTREEMQRSDGQILGVPQFTETNFAGEIAYMWKYQINHMYLRYFFWNYVGRKSDVQDAPSAWFDDREVEKLNYKSGYADEFPVRFFALPLLFGLFGLVFHFRRDPKMGFVYLIMFLLMGVLAAIAQNQQEPQPRERDYFYAGSFFVFCMWIGMGVYGIIEEFSKKKLGAAATSAVLIVSFLLVPLNMAVGGWKIHSRAGNYVPFDYSYNILQSTEKNSIIFTNGDNDTFPLWYLQDVSGVRRDVRVVNLSLGNTLWYIDQLKNREPWGAEKVPISFADDSLRVEDDLSPMALSYDFGPAAELAIPVRREILEQYTDDPAVLQDGHFRTQFLGQPYGSRENKTIYMFRVQDKLIRNILENNRFERPVYFSTTVGPDAYCGLDRFFRYEGMAMRICPVPQKTTRKEAIDPEIMEKCLMDVDNSGDFSKTPEYGFKFRNLNNMDVYYNEVNRRLTRSYRELYVMYAGYHANQGNNDKAAQVLDMMNKMISPDQFPMNFDLEYRVAMGYHNAGADERADQWADRCIKTCRRLIETPDLKPELTYYETTGRYIGPYRTIAMLYEMKKEYAAAIEMLQQLYAKTDNTYSQYKDAPGYEQDAQKIRYVLYDLVLNMDEYRIDAIEHEGNLNEALDTARAIHDRYMQNQDPAYRTLARYIYRKITELESKIDSAAIATETGEESQQ